MFHFFSYLCLAAVVVSHPAFAQTDATATGIMHEAI